MQAAPMAPTKQAPEHTYMQDTKEPLLQRPATCASLAPAEQTPIQ